MKRIFLCLALALAAILTLSAAAPPRPPAHASDLPGMPRFGGSPTVTAVQSGPWSDPATWSRPPLTNDVVLIPGEVAVVLDTTAVVGHVRVEGELGLDDGSSLTTTTLFGATNSLIATPTNASGASLIFRDAPLNLTADPAQFGNGFVSAGEVMFSGQPKTPFLRVLSGISNAPNFILESTPENWAPGDVVCVPESAQLKLTKALRNDGVDHEQTEVATIVRVLGAFVEVNRPLKFLASGAHIANLTRSVVIRSANPAGTRGHVMFLETATVSLRNVEFSGLGRTSALTPLDSAKRQADGSLLPGANQIGRYSLHLHFLRQPFLAEGLSIHDGRKWAMAVHNTHFGLVTNCVFARCDGAGLMTEDGSERANVITKNFALGIRPGYQDTFGFGGINKFQDNSGIIDTGLDGSGFWFRAAGNHVYDNVAAACFTGFNYNGYYLPEWLPFPSGPGLLPEQFSQARLMPAGISQTNEAYGVGIGLWLTWPQGTELDAYTRTAYGNYRLWNVYGNGVEIYHTAHVTLHDFSITNNPAISSLSQGDDSKLGMIGRVNTGVFAGHDAYENGGLTLSNLTIRGFNIGAQLPLNTETDTTDPGIVTVTGGLYANYANLVADLPMTSRQLVITNVAFAPSGVSRVGGSKSVLLSRETDLWMRFALIEHAAEALFDYSTVTFNGRSAFYAEQRADFVIPKATGVDKKAVGKTNLQLVQSGRDPVCGVLAPANPGTLPRVEGLLSPAQ